MSSSNRFHPRPTSVGDGQPGLSAASANGCLEIYPVLAEHQKSENWRLRELASALHLWAGRFAFQFKLEIPLAAIRLESLHPHRLGHFCCAHNGFGLRNEIAINTDYVNWLPFWQVLGTLLHEQLHFWQHIHGIAGHPPYHNVEYQRKATSVGLIVDGRGATTYAAESPFMALLHEHAVEVPSIPLPPSRRPGISKLKKWSCGCTNVRVAVSDFRALCLRCNKEFLRND